MAFAGLKKQINKANQFVNEKIGGVEGTKLDEEFIDMEKKTDITNELVEELQNKTKEYLQPNPTARAKMAAVKGISKLSGQAKASTYPQPEGTLGECMITYGRKIGDDSVFGQSLVEAGETLKQMADVKYSLDDNVKQNFLDPLHQLQTKDLKEVIHHRKKLQGRRLDFDCKKRKMVTRGNTANISEEEIRLAEDKFTESLHLAQMGMYNLLENDVEQVSQLSAFAECLYEYHMQCAEIMKGLTVALNEKKREAANRPKREYKPKTLQDLQRNTENDLIFPASNNNGGPPPPYFPSGINHPNSGAHSSSSSPVTPPLKPAASRNIQTPVCKALYDFEPENPGELGFREGDHIQLVSRIDENCCRSSAAVARYFAILHTVQKLFAKTHALNVPVPLYLFNEYPPGFTYVDPYQTCFQNFGKNLAEIIEYRI
ncbi:unnamed protein product [Allacma fusca]|uniref:BAR domain-containing protein n=1 Tax=Allacma fusca TaxID=39272 RepID=A0A8J2L1X5_9HEXA|nr:unnamed protein product [Allacma fusca]